MNQDNTESLSTSEAADPDDRAEVVSEKKREGGWLRELVETLVLTLLIFFAVRTVVQSFRVDGPSMQPTLHTNQLVMVNKAVYWRADSGSLPAVAATSERSGFGDEFYFHPPNRGDVIVFRAPLDPTRDYIKRVIGLPGDLIEIRDGKVFVNGKQGPETYISPNVFTETNGVTGNRMRVPEDSLFVLGDNRPQSSDSRDWGVVPLDNVVGKAMLVYWPLDEIGGLPQAVHTGGARLANLVQHGLQ